MAKVSLRKTWLVAMTAVAAYLIIAVTHAFQTPPLIGVYLTFPNQDTGRFIKVNFVASERLENPAVLIGLQSPGEAAIEPVLTQIKGVPRFYYSAEIGNLKPDTVYYFKIAGFEEEYKFRTLPVDNSPVRVMQGGDMGVVRSTIIDVAKEGLKYEPHVILIGGDIAYANGNTKNYGRWDQWLEIMKHSTVTPDGFMVPLILAIGNHEVNLMKIGPAKERAPFYYAMFRQTEGDKTFFARDLGKHSRLYVLDTGHIYPHFGPQSTWLNAALADSFTVPNKLALYHIPLYPSVRPFGGPQSAIGRHFWLPIFDHYRLSVAFENHDHAMKRTKLMWNNMPVQHGGTLYLGDGCWGKSGRKVKYHDYIEHADDTAHVWIGNLTAPRMEFFAVGREGAILDETAITRDYSLLATQDASGW